jgi:Zn-dependent protease with chaperone function
MAHKLRGELDRRRSGSSNTNVAFEPSIPETIIMATDALYPPAPANVPPEITRLDSAYRWRVVAMIAGLFVFLILYLVFIAVAGLVAYWLLVMPLPEIRGRGIIVVLIFKFGGAFAAVLLWLFLFKGLFKGRKVERSTYTTLQEKDHPALFAFIRQVYQDTGSPRPRPVYVSPEVNAALVYDTSLLNLFIPPRKDLLIGLGLVNVVNLAEFKAVLAHEFGHFAQRSVGLGSYLYVANRVMHDIIYSRDALDQFVDRWAQEDVRFSFPAWGLKGVLWVVRKILAGTYQALNLLHLSLSRQLEYNADNVAVRITGSDALIHSLSRMEFASECLSDAARSLDAAADHGLFTDDLFYHQTQAAGRLRQLRKEEQAGLPPELPEDPSQQVQVFPPLDDGIPERYRSHPADYMRERNAKRIYIRSPLDGRSPWLLFGNLPEVKKQVTGQFYRHALDRREAYEPRSAALVQEFINAEHAESTYDPKYHGLYDDRFINPGDLQNLPAQPWPREEAATWLSNWPAADLQQRLEKYRERQSEYHLLRALQSGELAPKGKTFPFRGQECTIKDVDRLFTQVDKELDADIEGFSGLDRKVFLGHWSLARCLDQSDGQGNLRETDLLERYRFHMALQGLLQGMLGEQGRLQAVLEVISKNSQLPEADFHQLRTALQEIYQSLRDNLQDAQSLRTPSLTNVPAGSSLYSFIVDRGDTALGPLAGDTISGEWLGKLMNRLEGVLSRLKRLHFKSLGTLLAHHEKLATEWQAASAVAGVQPTTAVASADG